MANEINIKSEPNSNIEVTDISTITTDITEGATIKVTADTAYDSSKQYIYYNSPSNPVVIQDTGHFNCIKNGYYSIANGISHYYTKSGDNYNYNAVPDISTWAGKYSFSNTIENIDLYSISQESERICVSGNYYKKNGNNYVKQDVLTYHTYDDNISVSWNNKYIAKTRTIEDPDTGDEVDITSWKTESGTIATSGYYLSVDKKPDGTYIVQFLNLIFNEMGVLSDSITTDALYKLYGIDPQNTNSYYIKNGNKLEELNVNQSSHTFTTDPATDNNFYIYLRGADWSYPNTVPPNTIQNILTDSNGAIFYYSAADFPLYSEATATEIPKTQHASYTIYEKTAVKINYNYSGDANSLIPVYVSESAPLNNLSS